MDAWSGGKYLKKRHMCVLYETYGTDILSCMASHYSFFSSLNTKLIFLKVLGRLVPPSFICISTSARTWPEKLDPQLPSEVVYRFMTLTIPTNYQAFNSQGPPTRECSSGLNAT